MTEGKAVPLPKPAGGDKEDGRVYLIHHFNDLSNLNIFRVDGLVRGLRNVMLIGVRRHATSEAGNSGVQGLSRQWKAWRERTERNG